MSTEEQAAHDRILRWCRSNPLAGMHPVMRTRSKLRQLDGELPNIVADVNHYPTAILAEGRSWQEIEPQLAAEYGYGLDPE